MVSRSWAISSSSRSRPSRVRVDSRMSTISVAWTSENSNAVTLECRDGRGAIRGGADRGDDLVDQVQGPEEALDDVGPSLRLGEAEL